jgi:hypothetical protein
VNGTAKQAKRHEHGHRFVDNTILYSMGKQRGGNPYPIEQSILLSAGTSNFLGSKGADSTDESKSNDNLHVVDIRSSLEK